MKEPRACKMCGARARSSGFCSHDCKSAFGRGLTLQQMIEADTNAPYPDGSETHWRFCTVCNCRWCVCKER